MTTEAVPAALDALVTLFAGVTVSGVELQVSDGVPLLEENDYLAVGFGYDEDTPGVDVADTIADAAMRSDLEAFDVANQLSCATGDGGIAEARTRVFTIFRALRSALAADPTLGGAVARARVSEYHLIQAVGNGAGAAASINFTIRTEAWRQP